MNRRNIKAILAKRIKEWADSVSDEKVKKAILTESIITGGCIASMLLKEEVKDYDIYFKTRDAVILVAEYYTNLFNLKPNRNGRADVIYRETLIEQGKARGDSSGLTDNLVEKIGDRVKIYIESAGVASTAEEDKPKDGDDEKPREKFQPVFLSSNAITLSDKIQVVIRFFGHPDEIHENYDFVHCTNYYTPSNGNLVLHPAASEALLAKELIYSGSKYPICSVIRTRKFIKRGFHINGGQYLKMALQISELDLTNPDVLEDQLCGVDSAYFSVLIEAIQEMRKKNPTDKISGSYIAEVVDRIFNG